MYRNPFHSSVISGIVLLVFLFSANGLLFGSHAVEEMLSETTRIVCDGDDFSSRCELQSSLLHHDHSHHSHSDTECCGAHGHHCHDFRIGQPLIASPLFPSPQRRFFDIAAYNPEIYLERFIPPENPA